MANPTDRPSAPAEPDDVASLRRRVFDLEQQLASLPDRDAALRQASARADRLAEELTAMAARCDELDARLQQASTPPDEPVERPSTSPGGRSGVRALLRRARGD